MTVLHRECSIPFFGFRVWRLPNMLGRYGQIVLFSEQLVSSTSVGDTPSEVGGPTTLWVLSQRPVLPSDQITDQLLFQSTQPNSFHS